MARSKVKVKNVETSIFSLVSFKVDQGKCHWVQPQGQGRRSRSQHEKCINYHFHCIIG